MGSTLVLQQPSFNNCLSGGVNKKRRATTVSRAGGVKKKKGRSYIVAGIGRSSAHLGRLSLPICLEMKINVRDSSMVLPSSETPRHALWLSKLDRAIFVDHVPSVYFYRPNGNNNFFDTKVMKESLGRALVHFYPLAGRLHRREDGPLEIDCNGGGVLFVEADAEGEIDDFGDFAPSVELRQLVPKVDYQNEDISSYPLLLLQVTFFRCGGVGLGVGMHHAVVDACGAIHFMNSWSHVARGLEVNCPPIIDRTILRARDPPRTTFEHLEYMPPTEVPSKQKPQNAQLVGAIFRFNRHQLARLKEKVNEGNTSTTKHSTFKIC